MVPPPLLTTATTTAAAAGGEGLVANTHRAQVGYQWTAAAVRQLLYSRFADCHLPLRAAVACAAALRRRRGLCRLLSFRGEKIVDVL